jgi:dipeptidyl aminopeptidase/acylaminoacyl peptidase
VSATPALSVATSTPNAEPPSRETELLPPTPSAQIGDALRAFTGNALLYTRPDRFLMLADPGGRQIWLTADERFCGRSNTALSQSGAWSADGRYIAIHCQDDGFDSKMLVELFTLNVLDTATGKLGRINTGSDEGRGIRVDTSIGLWAPAAPRLLVYTERTTAMETDTQHVYGWSVFDVETGTISELITFDPDAGSYPEAAWSPDGSEAAVIGRRVGEQQSDVYVVNIKGSAARRLKLDDVASFYGFNGGLAWSPDGQFLLLNRQLNPSPNIYVYQELRVDIKSGGAAVLADNLDAPAKARWSPDGRWFLLSTYTTRDHTIMGWSLYRADGTFVRTFSSDPARSVENIVWMPDSHRLAIAANRVEFGVEVIVANLEGQEQVIATRPGAFVHQIAVAPDSTQLAIGMGERLVILDAQGQVRAELDGKMQGWRPAIP